MQNTRSWPLSTAFFSTRHRKIDEKCFDLILYKYLLSRSADWAQNNRLAIMVHLDKVYRVGKKKNLHYKYSQAMKDAKSSYHT